MQCSCGSNANANANTAYYGDDDDDDDDDQTQEDSHRGQIMHCCRPTITIRLLTMQDSWKSIINDSNSNQGRSILT